MSQNELFPHPCPVCNHRKPQSTHRLFSAIASPCAHVYCYECAARRECCTLESDCPICHEELNYVFVVRGQPDATEARSLLVDFLRPDFQRTSKPFVGKLCYDTTDGEDINKLLMTLSYFQCSACNDDSLIRNLSVLKYNKSDFAYLSVHLKIKHNLYMCELCFLTLKPFSIDQEQLNQIQLESHMRDGSTVAGHGIIKHSECVLCKPVPNWQSKWHWDDAALAIHQAEKHISCHYCTDLKYFANQLSLNNHIEQEHFPCDFCCLQEGGRKIGFTNQEVLKSHINDKHSGRQQTVTQVVASSNAASVAVAPAQVPLINFDGAEPLPNANNSSGSSSITHAEQSTPTARPSSSQSSSSVTNQGLVPNSYQELAQLGQAAYRSPYNINLDRNRNNFENRRADDGQQQPRGDVSPFRGRGRGRGHK